MRRRTVSHHGTVEAGADECSAVDRELGRRCSHLGAKSPCL
jgi:hypothetical protein